jgi:hypothetical protein
MFWFNRFDGPFDQQRLSIPTGSAERLGPVVPASTLRAFYSGHSLSDGIPEQVMGIAQSLSAPFDFEFQSLPGSLIRKRTKGVDPNVPGWPGLKTGANRRGSGLDVEAALRSPWDALVVTERHGLPRDALEEETARYLRVLHDFAIAGNPNAQTLLYHTWLPIDFARPHAFVDYERAVLVLWECVASALNRDLEAAGRSDRIRVLPGGTALADLVEMLARGDIPSVQGATPGERVKVLFSDHVHLTPSGKYFMGAVHYAALFGKSPEGAEIPAGIPGDLGTAMQKLAWEHVRTYSTRARAASARSMDVCRDYAVRVIVPRFHEHLFKGGAIDAIRNAKRRTALQSAYADRNNPKNPFR